MSGVNIASTTLFLSCLYSDLHLAMMPEGNPGSPTGHLIIAPPVFTVGNFYDIQGIISALVWLFTVV
jgi:hypothetical protein